MTALISWVAVAVVTIFFLFILKRLISFAFGFKRGSTPLPDELADVAEDVAGASRLAATFAGLAAFLAAPAGLLAIAAAMGLAPKPLIVILLPTLVAFAVGAAALSAAAKLYAKAMRRRK